MSEAKKLKIGGVAVDLKDETARAAASAKYTKPSGGIPESDLSSSVQTSLGKADTAIQDVSDKEDKSNKATTLSESSTDTQYASAKAAWTAIKNAVNAVKEWTNEQLKVISEAIAALSYENKTLRSLLNSENDARISLALETLDAVELRRMGFPMEIVGAGAPSASIIPDDWDELCPNVAWKGYPYAPGMYYYDKTNGHYYKAKPTLSSSVSDWVLIG